MPRWVMTQDDSRNLLTVAILCYPPNNLEGSLFPERVITVSHSKLIQLVIHPLLQTPSISFSFPYFPQIFNLHGKQNATVTKHLMLLHTTLLLSIPFCLSEGSFNSTWKGTTKAVCLTCCRQHHQRAY